MKKQILSAAALFITLGSSAFANSQDCTPLNETRGNIAISRTYYSDDGTCNLSVSNKNNMTIYRDYSFDQNGGMLVFTLYGEFDNQQRFGTREFFFLPKKNNFPDFSWNDETQELEVIMTSGDKAFFSYQTAGLKAIENAQITIDDYLHPRTQGGVEINQYKGLLVDTSFTLDRLSSQNRNGLSILKDSKSNTCKVANRSLFRYLPNGNVQFKLKTPDLKSLLEKQCPGLELEAAL